MGRAIGAGGTNRFKQIKKGVQNDEEGQESDRMDIGGLSMRGHGDILRLLGTKG
ncbi:hypothetical protein D3C81_2291400 [compost metagenome]